MADIGAEDANFTEENIFASADDAHVPAEEKPKASGKLSKLKKTLKRIMIGFVVILIGVAMFFLGGILGSGENIATIAPSPVQAENNNKLVYLSAAPTEHEFTDPMFNITAKGLGLDRAVEMYQWVKEGDKYVEKWSEEIIVIEDADAQSKGYTNPASLPFTSEKWHADNISLGSFTLSPDLAKQIHSSERLPLTNDNFLKLNQDGQKAFKLYKDSYFFGINPEKPNIGDLRINFEVYPAPIVSVLAKQSGASLDVFLGQNGPIGIVRAGNVGVEAILQDIDLGENSTLKWSLRGVSGLFALVGVVVIIGRRKKKPAQDKELHENEIISHNETYVAEEPEPAIPAQTYQSEYSEPVLEQSFEADAYDSPAPPTPPPSYDNFTEDGRVLQPNYEASAFPPLPSEMPSVAEPAMKAFVAPQPLDFTFGESPDPQMQAEKPLPQFTSDTDPFSGASVDFSPPAAPEITPSFATSEYTDSPFGEAPQENYAGNEYVETQPEEMPFEVDVITDDSIAQEPPTQEIGYNPPPEIFNAMPESFAEASPLSTAEVIAPPLEQNYNNHYDEPLHPSVVDEIMPEGVEIISEEEADTEASSNEGGGFEELAHEVEFIQEEEVVTAPQEATFALPPPPDYDSLFAATTSNAAASEESYPLPPPPDFDKLFGEASTTTETSPTPDGFALPEIPGDFNPNEEMAAPIQSYEVPAYDIPEPEQNVASVTPTELRAEDLQSLTFDLPSIPADFDPNAEMLDTASPYDSPEASHQHLGDDHFSGDDHHSPFGDAEDDPFAHHDENKS